MKKTLLTGMMAVAMAGGTQGVRADDGWSTAGKILTGVAIGATLSGLCAPCPPPVYVAPPPVCVTPTPVVVRPAPVAVMVVPITVKPVPVIRPVRRVVCLPPAPVVPCPPLGVVRYYPMRHHHHHGPHHW